MAHYMYIHVVPPPLSDQQHNIIVLYSLHWLLSADRKPVGSKMTNMQWRYKRGHIIYMCFITNQMTLWFKKRALILIKGYSVCNVCICNVTSSSKISDRLLQTEYSLKQFWLNDGRMWQFLKISRHLIITQHCRLG